MIRSIGVLATVMSVGFFCGCALVTPAPRQVVFTAMGCGPYDRAAEAALERFIKLDNQIATSQFVVHCGDIVTGRNTDWPESQYIRVAEILKNGNRIPTFIVPGDNEWNDQTDPDRHWGYWEKHFLEFERHWKLPTPVMRQENRPENFAFNLDGTLVIGINKVGGKVHDADEWKRRLSDNGHWIAMQFEKHRKEAHSAVILAQARAPGNTDQFVDSLIASAATFAKPILYLHADGHKWFVKEGNRATNITHVQMDLISSNFPPIQVTVTGDPSSPWLFDRRQNSTFWGTAR